MLKVTFDRPAETGKTHVRDMEPGNVFEDGDEVHVVLDVTAAPTLVGQEEWVHTVDLTDSSLRWYRRDDVDNRFSLLDGEVRVKRCSS